MTHDDARLYDSYSCIALKNLMTSLGSDWGKDVRFPRALAHKVFDIVDAMMAERATRISTLPLTSTYRQ